ncbi:MAG: hypothetical protein OEM58_05315 [Nitrospirota bacterium]|nr:hypothetical protein [Nitrospirota bacterium]
MRVIVLGAGASHHAGYPLASSLLTKVEEHVKCSSRVDIKRDWSKWVSFRDLCPDYLQLVVRNNNPEVVFTLPSLLRIAAKAEDSYRIQKAFNGAEISEVEEQAGMHEQYHDSPGRQFLSQASIALTHLSRALDGYFLDHHMEDGQHRSKFRRKPLSNLFSPLQPGDVIITLNWDTTAERTLAENKKWSPLDGYGFSKNLDIDSPASSNLPVPDYLATSVVRVLKLHGSVGWYTNGDSVSFENSTYLNEFAYNHEDRTVLLTDPEYSYSHGINQLLVTPSFIKNLTHPILVKVWGAAHSALEQADVVDVWGYSLPEADGAARALFLGLKTRLNSGKVHVTVHDPCNATRERWLHCLGDLIHTKDEGLSSLYKTKLA